MKHLSFEEHVFLIWVRLIGEELPEGESGKAKSEFDFPLKIHLLTQRYWYGFIE